MQSTAALMCNTMIHWYALDMVVVILQIIARVTWDMQITIAQQLFVVHVQCMVRALLLMSASVVRVIQERIVRYIHALGSRQIM